ncbi:MAG: hypothetical protein AWU54_1375, partial [Candidatus Frackibacter sp. T328-2]
NYINKNEINVNDIKYSKLVIGIIKQRMVG